jgi:hypothetical protein
VHTTTVALEAAQLASKLLPPVIVFEAILPLENKLALLNVNVIAQPLDADTAVGMVNPTLTEVGVVPVINDTVGIP